jgi:uncharacterized delta-60 repeat protein
MTYPKSGLIAKVFCLAALLLPTFLPAQITFKHTYGGALDDEGRSVQQTADGGYIIAGYTCSYGSGREDVYLVKADSEGNEEWSRVYGGANYDEGWSVRQTADGGYVIAGQTESFGAGFTDLYLVRTDPYGETLWTRTYGGTSDDYGYSVELANEGGFVIAGSTKAYGAADHDVWLVRVNADGDTLWTRTYGISRWEKGYSVDQTADGGYIVAGRTCANGSIWDGYLVRTDSRGDTLWTRVLGGSSHDETWSVQQTTDGGYIVAGYTCSTGSGAEDLYLVRLGPDGEVLWTRTFGWHDHDVGYSVQQTADGGFIAAGYTYGEHVVQTAFYVVKVDSAGNTDWGTVFDGPSYERARSVQQTTDGGYVIAGHTTSYGAGARDVYLIKTDSLGRVGVEEPETPPARAPGLSLSCSPNPASASVTISLSPSIPLSLSPVLRLFDAQGRLVLSQPVRASSFTLHPSSLPAGVYVARLDFGTRHASSRLVLER